jgi:hypothetical protein
MKHRHIKAKHNEWIHVHREPASSASDWSWVIKAVVGVIAFCIFLKLLPYLLLGAAGLLVLKCFSR